MDANRSRGAAASLAVAAVLACGTDSRAGYDVTISASATDPHANVSAAPVGLTTLYLWLGCAEQGAAAMDVTVVGSIETLAFTTSPGVLNASVFPRLLLALADCPAGEDVDVLLGTFSVADTSAAGGRLSLAPTPGMADLAIASCDSAYYSYAYVPRAAGFASDGSPPDTTGAATGCGVFPPLLPGLPPVELPLEWAGDYGAPAGGQGTDGVVTLVRPLASDPDQLLVGGSFSAVGPQAAPNVARLTVLRDGGITTSWDVPAAWATLPPLSGAHTYLAADQPPAGGAIVVGGDDPDQPLAILTDTAVRIDSPPMHGTVHRNEIRAVEHWSRNGRFLVAGDFSASASDLAGGDHHGLAQYDPEAQDPWQPFGFPIASDVWYVAFDGSEEGAVDAMVEVRAPGKPLDGAVILGGRFHDVSGVTAGSIPALHCAWMDPGDGSMHGLDAGAPVRTLVQPPDQSWDGGGKVYAAGDFGDVDGSPGLERPPVLVCAVGGSVPGAWLPLTPGLFPHPGPMTPDAGTAPVIHALVATAQHLLAIGEFTHVLPRRGREPVPCGGFARFSFATREWESLGGEALGGAGRAGAVAWPVVFAGGAFTQVGETPVPSFHLARADFLSATTFVPTVASPAGPAVWLGVPHPNPARGGTGVAMDFALARAGAVDLAIYDVSGRLVARLMQSTMGSGTHRAAWDLRNAAGTRATPGVYLVRLVAGDARATRKVTISQ